MANDIAWEFDELRAYVKRLIVAADGLTGAEVAQIHGPGAGTVNAATSFRMELKMSALTFGKALDMYYLNLRDIHDTLNEVLAAAVEADASLADEAKAISQFIDQAAGAAPAAKSTSTGSNPAGQIG
ncbi:MAG: hypothetical protein JWR04_8 [Rhodoglobus sp.]|jgi:hypothetical protein|nr:hypothetical protein [Rhodoglobus sp.]